MVSMLYACDMGKLSEEEYLGKAKAHLSKNEQEAAAIELKNVLQQNPKNAEARFLLGKYYCLEMMGKVQKSSFLESFHCLFLLLFLFLNSLENSVDRVLHVVSVQAVN